MAARKGPDPRFNKHMTALGNACGIWAAFERHVDQVIWELADVDRRFGSCLTGQMIGPGPRAKALIAMIELRGGNSALLKAANAFAAKFQKLGALRNRAVHDPYAYDESAQSMKRVELTADKKLRFEFVPVPIQDLKALYEDIVTALFELHELYYRMLDELPPWSRKRYELSPGILSLRPSQKVVRTRLASRLKPSKA